MLQHTLHSQPNTTWKYKYIKILTLLFFHRDCWFISIHEKGARLHHRGVTVAQVWRDLFCLNILFIFFFFWFLGILIPLTHGLRAREYRRFHGHTHHCRGHLTKAMNIWGFNVSAYGGSDSFFLKPKIVSLRISLDAVISETFPCLLASCVILNNCFSSF